MPELEALPSGHAASLDPEPGAPAASGVLRVVLTGFMGAGKSTVGALLAARLGWQFIDVDAAIELAQGASVAALFVQHGEPWFRALEQATILNLLAIDRLVLALGGGAIEDAETRQALLTSPGTRLVHLEASLDTVLLRCGGTEAIRPVLRDKANLESRYTRRLPLYRQAHLTLPVDAIDAETASERLAALLALA